MILIKIVFSIAKVKRKKATAIHGRWFMRARFILLVLEKQKGLYGEHL
jgi:hypothetical protein